MSAQQPRITLRPPPHRDYLSGYPGIPACDPSTLSSPPTPDPLFPLSVVLRPQATLTGTVEIRSPLKGPAVRAKFLSVELEKIETVPPAPPSAGDGGGGGGGKKDAKAGGGGEEPDGRFVELIGSGPTKLWEAGSGAADGVERAKSPVKETPKKKSGGFKGLAKGVLRRPEFEDEEEDDGFEAIPDGNYPFSVPLPEGLPPTIEVDNKMNGVAYQIVATLICKGKKGLLKGAGKSTMVVASAPILLDKADLLRWPRYQPILPSPLPPKLPWAAPTGELTVGETKEAKLPLDRADGRSGEVWMKATRASAAFGPGDAVELFVQVGWGGDQPIKLTRLDAVLRETIRFTYPSPNNPNYIIRGPPKVNTLFTATASVSSDPNDQAAFAVLYQGEPVAFQLSGMVPSDHARVTTRTAKHVDVSYHLKIRAMIEGGDEISVDGWSVLLGTVSSRVGKGIMSEIGWVEGLCDRPGQPDPTSALSTRSPVLAVPSSRAANKAEQVPSFQPSPSPQQQQPSPAPPPAAFEPRFGNSSTEKSRLLNSSQTSSRFGSSHQASSGGYHVANPSAPTTPDNKPSTPLPAPAPVRPAFVPSPTAEEEKRAAYDRATQSREQLQSSLRASQEAAPSPTDSFRSPTAEDDDGALHQAAILRRSVIHNGYSTQPDLSPPLQDGFNDDTPLVARGHLSTGPARSNTLMVFSGSEVSAVPPPASPPPPPQPEPQSPPRSPPVSSPGGSSSATAFLGRSLTTAETEKRRLFLDAKETARRRQEEARLELERQNRALAELEFEEAQNAYEDRLVAEAEYDKRQAEHARLLAFEAEQKARIAADEERWAREEEERRVRALAELDERKRRAEQAMQEELRRFEEQQRAAEQEREDEIARQMAERKAEEEMKRAKAEELKRQDEEREREEQARRSAAVRKQEMERERAEMERRRREGEEARARAAAQAAAEAGARARWEEEERHLREEAERAEAAAAEAVRRREEQQRELARQRQAEEEARELQAAEEEARQRQAEEEARAHAAQQVAQQQPVYPATELTYGQPAYPNLASQPSDAAANIHRAPSVASFAPSTSAAAADASFYVQALAQHSSQSEAKAAYLRQLRQHEEQRRAAMPSPLAGRAPSVRRPSQPQPITPYQSDPSAAMNPYGGYPQPSFHPQPPLPPQPPYAGGLSRSNTYIPPTPSSSTAPAYPIESTSRPPLEHYSTAPTDPVPPPVPPLPASVTAAPPASSSSSSTGYKTAAEEKEEAAARRRAEDARGKQPAPVQEEDEEEDALPSYPVADTSATAPSAAEEKAEMERYYAAKAAVDARQAPPPPPARANTAGFDRLGNTPAPGYHAPSAPSYPSPSAPYSGGPAYPSQLSSSAGAHPSAPSEPARTAQLSENQSSGSHEPYRDPAIAAGKRTARPSTGGSSAAGPVESSYAYAPSAPPLPASSPSPGEYYASPPPPPLPDAAASQYGGGNGDISRADAQQALVDVNHAGFGSFSVDAFPEFEKLAGQIAAAARGGSAEQQ
ncbi:hypothetical protein JCM8097_003037 [Rhodosporidiobolus ruineniae]